MTNEAEITYLVLAIVATLIVKFVLTMTGSHNGLDR